MTDTFWLSFAGIVAGVISGTLVYLNKSKCKNFSCCWGAFTCIRDTKAEERLEEYKIDHQVPSTPTKV